MRTAGDGRPRARELGEGATDRRAGCRLVQVRSPGLEYVSRVVVVVIRDPPVVLRSRPRLVGCAGGHRLERRLEIAQTRRAANRAWGDHIKLYAATAWYRWNYDPANRNLDRVGFSHALLRIVTSDVEARGSDMDSKIRCGRGTHEDAKAMLSIREEYLAALALLDRCHAEALARGIYAAACEDKPAGNYTADRARDRKWHDVAAALVAEVSAQADA